MMKKLAATLFLIGLIAVGVFAQPTLTIKTETPGLPSELFYGSVKVKPVRLRPGTNTVITIADYDFFIQQNYIDLLKRFPEAGPDGQYGTSDDPMKFYLDILNGCNPSDVECIKFTRGALAANFFRSPEFQRKGSFVMYLYMVSIGQRPVTPAELPTKNDPNLNDRPGYDEFFADLTSISTPNDDPVLTDQKKGALADAWMLRPQIQSIYGGLSNSAFVQKLIDVSGVSPTGQNWVAELNAGTKTRARVLREFAEHSAVDAKFYNQAFVSMAYLGWLRRKPEDCHNSANWSDGTPASCGFIFHNERFKNVQSKDFLENTIVRGFIESPEYSNRF